MRRRAWPPLRDRPGSRFGGRSERGQLQPLAPWNGPVIQVPIGVGQRDTGADDLDRVPDQGRFEISLGVLRREVDATVADVVDALHIYRVGILVDELAV